MTNHDSGMGFWAAQQPVHENKVCPDKLISGLRPGNCTELNIGFSALETMLANSGSGESHRCSRKTTQYTFVRTCLNHYESECDIFQDCIIIHDETWYYHFYLINLNHSDMQSRFNLWSRVIRKVL